MVSDSHEHLVRTPTFAEVAASVKEIAPATVTPHHTTWTDAPHAASDPQDLGEMLIVPRPTPEQRQALREFALSRPLQSAADQPLRSNIGTRRVGSLSIRTSFPKYQDPSRISPSGKEVRRLEKENMRPESLQPYSVDIPSNRVWDPPTWWDR